MRKLLPILILALGIGGFAALRASRPAVVPVGTSEKAWRVAVETVEPRSLAPELNLYGRVESPRTARLTAAVEADVVEVAVLEGQTVAAGAPLLRLDDHEVRLVLDQRLSEVANIRSQLDSEARRYRYDRSALVNERNLLQLAKRDVQRAERLVRTQAGSRAKLDEARQSLERQALALQARELAVDEHASRQAGLEARLANARALAARARLDLSRTRLKAPFAGRITAVEVAPGDRVRVGAALVSLYDTSDVEIRAQIPTRHLAVVRDRLAAAEGLNATARVDDRPIKARLERLGGEVARGSGGSDGLFRVTDGSDWLDLGRVVDLRLALPPEPDVVALPYEAIYGTDRVYLVTGGRLRGITVRRVGRWRTANGESRALVRGAELTAGAKVLITQLPNAVDGLKIQIAER